MARQELTVAKLRSIISLPPRLAALAGAVGSVQHPGQPVRHHLQTGWAMSDLERAEARSLLSTLTSDLSPEAMFDVDGRAEPGHLAKGALLNKMIRGLAGAAEPSPLTSAAKVEMYADAIEDLPAWAIDKAIKRWALGECPVSVEENPNYTWPPSPATLRKMALFELDLPRRYVAMLTRLVEAIPMSDALDPDWKAPKQFGVGPALRRM